MVLTNSLGNESGNFPSIIELPVLMTKPQGNMVEIMRRCCDMVFEVPTAVTMRNSLLRCDTVFL
jgi:hypothetical protein